MSYKLTKTEIGRKGEIIAAKYLEEKGYTLLEQNYRKLGTEVDLIMEKDDTLVFVEVKSRKTNNYGLPEEFVDYRKRNKIIRAARVFTGCKEYHDYFVRFDIVAILDNTDFSKIKHIEHAFTSD